MGAASGASEGRGLTTSQRTCVASMPAPFRNWACAASRVFGFRSSSVTFESLVSTRDAID